MKENLIINSKEKIIFREMNINLKHLMELRNYKKGDEITLTNYLNNKVIVWQLKLTKKEWDPTKEHTITQASTTHMFKVFKILELRRFR